VWQGSGRFNGADASVELRCEAVLSERFVRLSRRVVMRTANGEREFEGHGYLPATAGDSVRGTWFDSEGHVYTIAGAVEGTALLTQWGPAGAAIGRTAYRVESGTMTMADSARGSSGAWREFGRMTLKAR
jgi:hypothetical protein